MRGRCTNGHRLAVAVCIWASPPHATNTIGPVGRCYEGPISIGHDGGRAKVQSRSVNGCQAKKTEIGHWEGSGQSIPNLFAERFTRAITETFNQPRRTQFLTRPETVPPATKSTNPESGACPPAPDAVKRLASAQNSPAPRPAPPHSSHIRRPHYNLPADATAPACRHSCRSFSSPPSAPRFARSRS